MKKAAELGLPEAQHTLGVRYLERSDHVKALAWFLEAGKSNFTPSVVNVGTMFLKGAGPILSNPLAAKIWFELAYRLEPNPNTEELLKTATEAMLGYRRKSAEVKEPES